MDEGRDVSAEAIHKRSTEPLDEHGLLRQARRLELEGSDGYPDEEDPLETTYMRAHGATYHHGCIWFDHSHPPEWGYGYVAASRFKSTAGTYIYGKACLLYTSPSPRDQRGSRMPSSA